MATKANATTAASGSKLPWETSFADEVRRLRAEAGMSQTQLASRMQARGLTFYQQQVNRIETHERPVRLNEAMILAAVFNRSLSDMLGDAADPPTWLRYAESAVRDLEAATSETEQHVRDAMLRLGLARDRANHALQKFLQTATDRGPSEPAVASMTVTINRATQLEDALEGLLAQFEAHAEVDRDHVHDRSTSGDVW